MVANVLFSNEFYVIRMHDHPQRIESTNYLVGMCINNTKLHFTHIRVNIYCPFINHSKIS